MTFIELSKAIFKILDREEAFRYHIIRYRFFYEGSPKRDRCTYAIQSKKLFIELKEYDILFKRLTELGHIELAKEVLRHGGKL